MKKKRKDIMKKLVKRLFVLFLTILMACTSNMGVFASEIIKENSSDNNDYPEKYLWYVKNGAFYWGDYDSAYAHHKTLGQGEDRDGRGWDMDAYVNSEIGQGTIQNLEPFILYGKDPMGQDILDYWAKRGMKKQVFDADDKERVWSLFTPLTMDKAENANKKYPVIFNFHGKNNPIEIAETYGYVELGGKEDFIVICPWGNNGDGEHDAANGGIMMEEVARIWDYVRNNYPVDESRVYCSGFSGGGRATQVAAYTYQSMFAAIAPSPQFFVTNATDSQWTELEKIGMPLVCVAGFYDKYMPVRTQGQIDNVQHWLKVNGVAPKDITLENIILRSTYTDKSEALAGLPFDKTDTIQLDGCDWYEGEYYNTSGQSVVRVAVVSQMPHWPSASWASYNWDFMKHWSRNTETGELIYSE